MKDQNANPTSLNPPPKRKFQSVKLLMGTLALVAILLGGLGSQAHADTFSVADPNATPVYDIPRMDKVVIDGNAADWGDGGFRVDQLMPLTEPIRTTQDLDVRIRLGWNDKGLLLLAHVHDDQWMESTNLDELWDGDAIEVFLAPRRGDAECGQWVISPGMVADQPEVRWHFYDGRSDKLKDRPAKCLVARTKTADGYILTALLPFEALGIEPKLGKEIGFQVWVADKDQDKKLYQAAWYPGFTTIIEHLNMNRVRLSDHASPPVQTRAVGTHNVEMLTTTVTVAAPKELTGKSVRLLGGGRTLAETTLADDGSGRAGARVALPMPPLGSGYRTMQVQMGDAPPEAVTMANGQEQLAEAIFRLTVVAHPCVFSGKALPEVAFEQPYWVQHAIGRYTVKTTYYDREYNVVTNAAKPGRYGAVAEITTAQGRMFRRFVTLFCTPEEFRPWRMVLGAKVAWPDALGVPAGAGEKHEGSTANFLTWLIFDDLSRSGNGAVLLSGLYETRPDDPDETFYTAPERIDRQWWVGLKRKLYGWDKQFAKPFGRPMKIDGPPARVLHEGTAAEAGMKADATQKIDAVLTEWSKDTDEAFAVCVAHHGVIVLHKAYGVRDGKPMTVHTKSEMASASKMLSGTSMMMLVDQGVLDLGDEPGKFLPPLAGLKGANGKAATIRHLYSHTSGDPQDWHDGAELNDMEERYAVLLPELRVGEAYAYDGLGLELSCKILEAASGLSLPEFYRTHLLEPLGCTDIDMGRASSGTQAAPLAVAKILQMVLNKGAYGQWRFFSEETYQQLLPVRQTRTLGPDTKYVYGVGTARGTTITSNFLRDGLSNNTFGHGAASGATIRVDPDNDLVIVMTRNSSGKNWDKYHGRFIRAIVDGIDRPAASEAASTK